MYVCSHNYIHSKEHNFQCPTKVHLLHSGANLVVLVDGSYTAKIKTTNLNLSIILWAWLCETHNVIVCACPDQLFISTNYWVQDQILHGILSLLATCCYSYHSVHVHQSPASHSQWGGAVYIQWLHTAKIKPTKVFSGVPASISAKFLHSQKNSHYRVSYACTCIVYMYMYQTQSAWKHSKGEKLQKNYSGTSLLQTPLGLQ